MNNTRMTDIAKTAGVSLATVGRALHGGYISDEKKKRIDEAIAELGYIPNMAASGLKSSHSRLIGNLMRFNPNQLYAKIALGIERNLMNSGYSMLALTMYNKDEERAMIDELISRRVDGIILTSMTIVSRAEIEKIRDMGISVVMVERAMDIPYTDSILIDDFGGAYKAVKSLYETGRKRIGFIGEQVKFGNVENDRYRGYEKAVAEDLGCTPSSLVSFTKGYDIEDGYMAAEKLFKISPVPDALFCTSDILAAGAMQYLYKRKIRIPEDVSIIGYDDTISSFLSPKISSVSIDIDRIGSEAAQMIISRLSDSKIPSRKIYTDTILRNRFS
jgi:DNA-binding LacI/PurR family transcriptional regulator